MIKPAKTQWEFGELFPIEPTRKILSVGDLTAQIRRLLEKGIGQVWVTGEITNLKVQNSGHIYFTLKDAAAQVSCVLFRGEYQVDRSLVQDGRKVVLSGEVTVYEARGQYQLRVTSVELQGVGALQLAFEKLKQKLKAEGLFETARKRPLPRFPRRIGLVTSPTGAAIRDVLHAIERRNRSLEIIFAPCRVQGDGAAGEIAAAIRTLNQFHGVLLKRSQQTQSTGMPALAGGLDLILVTRGGGSLEDLWAFNEEVVARAIFESGLPVISAVGHEIDFTISDFVADFRAATPSAAAEIITADVVASCQFITQAGGRLRQLLRQRVEDKSYLLGQTRQRLMRLHPRRRVQERLQLLDDLQTSLLRCARNGIRQQRQSCRGLFERLGRVRPAVKLKQRREVLGQIERRLTEQAHDRLREAKIRLQALEGRLRLLGPEQVLARGYSITIDADTGAVLREAKEAQTGKKLRTRLRNGEIVSRVEK